MKNAIPFNIRIHGGSDQRKVVALFHPNVYFTRGWAVHHHTCAAESTEKHSFTFTIILIPHHEVMYLIYLILVWS